MMTRVWERVGILPGLVGTLDEADGARPMPQHHGRGVLADVLGVAPLRLAGNALDLAEENPRKVEDVYADVEDRQLGLPVEVGLGPVDIEARPEGEAAPARRADDARGERLGDPGHRGLVAEVLVHRQPNAGPLRLLDHRHAGRPVRGEGLLHDDRHLVPDGQPHEVEMGLHARRDVDEIEPLRGQQRRGIRVVALKAESLGGGLGLALVDVADGDEVDALGPHVSPGIQVVLGKESRPDQRASHDCSPGLVPSDVVPSEVVPSGVSFPMTSHSPMKSRVFARGREECNPRSEHRRSRFPRGGVLRYAPERSGETEGAERMGVEAALREALCLHARSLFDRGFTVGSSGNISVRLDDGFLVTPTNSCLGRLDPARLSKVSPDWTHLSGDKPTKEIPLHRAMLAARPGAGAVVHLHSTYATAVSMLSDVDPADALPPMTPYLVMRVGRLAVVPYSRPGASVIEDSVRHAARTHKAILLANHGPVVADETLEAAVFASEELEESARLYILTRGLPIRLLTDAQVQDLVSTFLTTAAR